MLARLAYNLGRIVTYSALGALFGSIGKTLALAGVQQVLSVRGLSLGIPYLSPDLAAGNGCHLCH